MLGEERAKTFFEEAACESPEQIIAHLLEEEKASANGRAQDDDVDVHFLAPMNDKVVLGVEYRKMLDDPHHLLQGSRTQVRQVVLRKKSDIKKNLLMLLILEAVMIVEEGKRK